MSDQTLRSSDDAWDDGVLGADEKYVAVAPAALSEAADLASGTQLISIRMQQAMIDDMKAIAAANGGMGYQTLMKQILQRFIDSEKKQVWNEYVRSKAKQLPRVEESTTPAVDVSQKKKRKAA